MATKIPAQLKETAEQVASGSERSETVRTLLSWFGAERRGYWKVREIQRALNRLKLTTEPYFEDAWIDATITFLLKSKAKSVPPQDAAKSEDNSSPPPELAAAPIPHRHLDGKSGRVRIGMLAAANRPPSCVSPDAEISEAITLMLQHDYSQLPVTTTERDVKGLFSWKSLGSRLALGRACKKVSESMEPASEIRQDASLFEAVPQIVEHQCILVRDATRKLVGIVTTADLSLQFAQLGEPFLLLGQIENHIRTLIADKYTATELKSARDPADHEREIEDVSDLTLGEYVRLLENPKRWEKLALKVDRKTFVEELRKINRIRNDVMHFDPDGVGTEDLTTIRKFARFLDDLEKRLN